MYHRLEKKRNEMKSIVIDGRKRIPDVGRLTESKWFTTVTIYLDGIPIAFLGCDGEFQVLL